MDTPTLLLADHSIATRRLVHLAFADQPIRLVVAEDGYQALGRIEADRPDYVLAATELSGKDGYAIARYVSKTLRLRKMPVLLLTNRSEAGDKQRARESGAKGIVRLPCDPGVLLTRVRRALRIKVSGTMPAERAQQISELIATFHHLDAATIETRSEAATTPESLALIVSDAVANAIAAYERARVLPSETGLQSDQTQALPQNPILTPVPLRDAQLRRLQREMGIDQIAFEELPPRPTDPRSDRVDVPTAPAETSRSHARGDFDFDLDAFLAATGIEPLAPAGAATGAPPPVRGAADLVRAALTNLAGRLRSALADASPSRPNELEGANQPPVMPAREDPPVR